MIAQSLSYLQVFAQTPTQNMTSELTHAQWAKYAWAYDGDEFFPIYTWPQWLQDLFMQQHHNRSQRFLLYLFFVGNGLHPRIAIPWIVYDGGYDTSAQRQMNELLTKGPPNMNRRTYTYWDINESKNMTFPSTFKNS
jgi:hypothetical protein